ncbi:MAG TPA: hypothetical protein VKQ30_03245 [Ktedonobacterales bacterium]|nr:hypothetical protein [Ktedonobacterales bacterium]
MALQPKIYQRFDNWLAGKPDAILTFLLLAGAVVLVIVALQPNRPLKALVLAWEVLP